MVTPMRATFYDLPAELRNEIYSHALFHRSPISLPYAYEKRPFAEPPLLSASRWIRAEAAPIFYGCNTFEAPSPPSAHRFLANLREENISMIRIFRPIDLILPLSAHKRWFDALRANINRLVGECGRGALAAEAVRVPIRKDGGREVWVRVEEVEDFEIVQGDGGVWQVCWKEGYGREELGSPY